MLRFLQHKRDEAPEDRLKEKPYAVHSDKRESQPVARRLNLAPESRRVWLECSPAQKVGAAQCWQRASYAN